MYRVACQRSISAVPCSTAKGRKCVKVSSRGAVLYSINVEINILSCTVTLTNCYAAKCTGLCIPSSSSLGALGACRKMEHITILNIFSLIPQLTSHKRQTLKECSKRIRPFLFSSPVLVQKVQRVTLPLVEIQNVHHAQWGGGKQRRRSQFSHLPTDGTTSHFLHSPFSRQGDSWCEYTVGAASRFQLGVIETILPSRMALHRRK